MHRLPGAEQPAGIAPGQAEPTAAAVHAKREAQEREQDSRDRLHELDLHKTAFISSISHELRTPLTSMSGYLELLMDGEAGPLTDLQRQMLTIIDRNGRRLLALLDDLLTLSSLEAGTLSVSNERVDVATLVHAAYAATIPMLRSRSLTCELNVDPDTGWVPGDPAELERALGNLVSNAAKFGLSDPIRG